MPTSVTPTLASLRNLVKIEARVSGAGNLDTWINALINELLCNYAANNRYFELLSINVIVPTVLNTGAYPLPADFVALRLIRYQEQGTGYIRTLNPRPQFIETARGRRPRWYDVAGDQLVIFNSDDVPANDSLLLDYYRYPATLTDADVFPIPKLVTPVKLEAVRRTLIYNQQLQAAQILKTDAVEHEVRPKMND